MPRKDQNPGKREKVVANRVKALDLRISGLSFRAVAARMKVDVKTAFGYVAAALADLAKLDTAKAEDLRRIEEERIDRGVKGLHPAYDAGDPAAVNAMVRLMERRAKLRGLDAPKSVEVSGKDGAAIPIQVIEVVRTAATAAAKDGEAK